MRLIDEIQVAEREKTLAEKIFFEKRSILARKSAAFLATVCFERIQDANFQLEHGQKIDPSLISWVKESSRSLLQHLFKCFSSTTDRTTDTYYPNRMGEMRRTEIIGDGYSSARAVEEINKVNPTAGEFFNAVMQLYCSIPDDATPNNLKVIKERATKVELVS